MADLKIDGLAIAPGVVETIVSLAAREVDGVESVGDPATSSIFSVLGGGKPSTQGVEADADEEGNLHIEIHLYVKSGHVLPDLAIEVRKAIADAVNTQLGAQVGSIDVFIDGIQFED